MEPVGLEKEALTAGPVGIGSSGVDGQMAEITKLSHPTNCVGDLHPWIYEPQGPMEVTVVKGSPERGERLNVNRDASV